MPLAVLLIDDLEDDRGIYGQGLRALGFEVTIGSADGAAEDARRHQPNVVVLHLGSDPGWSGCAALHRCCPDLPVIALTAAVRPDGANRERARATPNCVAFVGKPCTSAELAAVIRRVARGERGIELTTGAGARDLGRPPELSLPNLPQQGS